MIISSSISTASQGQSPALLALKSSSSSSEDVSISVVGIHNRTLVSKTDTKFTWGIEVSNDVAVVASGESVVVELAIDYSVTCASTGKKALFSDTSIYDITNLLSTTNISTPVFGKSDSAIVPKADTLDVTSISITLKSPSSTPYTIGNQTWNFTV